MKIAIITDTHGGVRNDNKALKAKQEQFYTETFFPTLEERGITTLLHLGDLFDRRKFINFETLSWWNRIFMNRLNEMKIECHFIAGNHDTYYKSTNEVNSLRELYDASIYENMNFHWKEPVDIDIDGTTICLAPWLAPDNTDISLQKIAESKAQILMGHFELTGFTMTKGQLCDHGLDADIFSRFHSVYSGHFHTQSSGKNIRYLGAPYEMTWNDYGERKGFHIFDTKTFELEFVENNHHSFHKIKYEDSDMTVADIAELDLSGLTNAFIKVIIINKTNPYMFDLLMDKLNQSGAADVKVVEDNKHLDELTEGDLLDQTESTEVILQKYIDALDLGTSFDKKVLQNFMLELYKESQTL